MTSELKTFIKQSIEAGKPKAEILCVLRETGWHDKQIARAYGYEETNFPVAVPKPEAYVSPQLVFLNLFFFLVLYMTFWGVVDILFTFLDYYLPDGLGNRSGLFYSSYRTVGDQIQEALATLVCTIPLTALSSYFVQKMMSGNNQCGPKSRLILINLTLFIGGCVVLGSGICLVYYFLKGELGLRFLIKIGILSAMVLGTYFFFKPEISSSAKEI